MRSIIKSSLNDDYQNKWAKLKAIIGISEDSKVIKFMIDAVYEEWIKYDKSVSRWFLDQKVMLMKHDYKPSINKVVNLEMTNKGLIEKESLICDTKDMPKSDTK